MVHFFYGKSQHYKDADEPVYFECKYVYSSCKKNLKIKLAAHLFFFF